MPVIETRLDPRDATFAPTATRWRRWSPTSRARSRAIEQGGGDAARSRHTGRGKLLPRERVARAARSGLAVPRVLAARRLRHVRRQHRRRRHHHRHRPRRRARVRDRLQRRDGQGRHLLSDDGEEASARAGHRAREQPALHLPGRFRRRQPAEPDRRVSGPRSFRPHLLQPGDDVGGRHSADRRRDGLVHGGRRLRAGDVGRVDHRQGAGDDLPRRAAAGEGGDRRDRQRRGAGRRRRAHARSPASPTTSRRTTIMRWRSRAASSAT